MATLEAGTTQRNPSPGAWRTEGPVNRVTWYLRSPKQIPKHQTTTPAAQITKALIQLIRQLKQAKGPEPGQMAAKKATPGSSEDCAVKGFCMELWNVKVVFARVQLTSQPVS